MNRNPLDPNLPLGYRWATEEEHHAFDFNDLGWTLATIYYAPKGRIYRHHTCTTLAVLDDRNREILDRSLTAFNARSELRSGDYIRFSDDTLRRISHIWRDEDDKPWRIQTSDGGSWSLHEGGGLSFSGSLFTPVSADTLTLVDEVRRGSAWFFHHGWAQAHHAVHVSIPLRVYTCTLSSTDTR